MCRESGFDGFLPKPADRDAIAAELERLAGSGSRKPGQPAHAQAKPAALAPTKALAGSERAPANLAALGGAVPSFLGAADFDTPAPRF